MFAVPFVLADRVRIEQFALLSRTRGLFREFEVWTDFQGIVWARKHVGSHCFAVSMLGPGWAFDPYGRQRRAEDLADSRHSMEAADAGEQRQALEQIIADVRLGPIAERVLWAIHHRVMQAKRSVVRIPDCLLARAVWGSKPDARPKSWRGTLRAVLQSLTWLHVMAWPEDGPPLLGERSALLTHAADLWGSPNDACDQDCPQRGGERHSHWLVNVGRGFLGNLDQFAKADDGSGVRTYEFKLFGRKKDGPTLQSVGRTGNLTTLYLPAKLGDPAVCRNFTPNQQRLLQAIIRETTRNTKSKGKGKRRDLSEAEVFAGNEIPGIQRRGTIACDLLDTNGKYVGFNGNKKLKGLGYCLTTPGGWLVKAGYACNHLERFFTDLAALAEKLEMIVVGIHVPSRKCIDLERLQTFALTGIGRRPLAKTHLRIYTTADYRQRWNDHFGWVDDLPIGDGEQADPTTALATEMKRKKISQRALAHGIEADPSFISKIFNGKKQWPSQLLKKAQAWVAACDEPADEPPRHPLLPLLAAVEGGETSMLDVALAYRERGWSVVPQNPGAKQPCVKWKPFQDRVPTEEELTSWFAQWPQAGLAVVLGPVSKLLVIDVDGTEAHDVLVERLGSKPLVPKALSGSRKPGRYHLFFRCPDIPTKAKATPWHSKLEFRGKGGIVIISPSLHQSGHRYTWAEGRCPDDLSLPELPAEIVAALQPTRPTPPPIRDAGDVSVENASTTTRAFLAGTYADGPDWNGRLFRAACDLAGHGMLREEAEPLLLAGARPWDETNAETARRTIESAFSEPREPSRY